jgi:hypothetical protein
MTNGISLIDFRRLLLTAIYVIFLYFPLCVYSSIENSLHSLEPYSWEKTHAPQWQITIPKEPVSTVVWRLWIGPVTALSLFSIFGTGRTACQGYKDSINWILGGLLAIRMRSCTPRHKRPRHANSPRTQDNLSVEAIALSRPRAYCLHLTFLTFSILEHPELVNEMV